MSRISALAAGRHGRTRTLAQVAASHALCGCLILAHLVTSRAFNISVHPTCKQGGSIAHHLQDVTALLRGPLPAGICIYNPSMARLHGDLFVWSAMAYTARDARYACVSSYEAPLPLHGMDRWRGRKDFILALARMRVDAAGALSLELLSHTLVRRNLVDGRLFWDGDGRMQYLTHVWPRMGVSAVEVRGCGQVAAAGPAGAAARQPRGGASNASAQACEVRLGPARLLSYEHAAKFEKNWVPLNGTSRTSYVHYRAFSPHSILDWGSYAKPANLSSFYSAAPEPFFEAFQAAFGELFWFSGGTPAVAYHDGESYLAVGHIQSRAKCFHANTSNHTRPNEPAAEGSVVATCTAEERHDSAKHQFYYRHGGAVYQHHEREYGMFLYRFASAPPHAITHLSHAFQPCTYHHSGQVFPTGLERDGPDDDPRYLIAYGESNRYARVMSVAGSQLERLLVPMAAMRAAVSRYELCTLPCPFAA